MIVYRDFIILYPERYLFILLLPWPTWILSVLLFQYAPQAKAIIENQHEISYVNRYGEIIYIGRIYHRINHKYIDILSHKPGYSCLIIKLPHFATYNT